MQLAWLDILGNDASNVYILQHVEHKLALVKAVLLCSCLINKGFGLPPCVGTDSEINQGRWMAHIGFKLGLSFIMSISKTFKVRVDN